MSANSYLLPSHLPLETPIPRKENRQCSLQSLLTRLPPQSVFVSVTVQGQCVFVVGQQQRQSSLRGPHARYAAEEREEKGGRKERSIPPTTVYVRVCACVCVCVGNSSMTQFDLPRMTSPRFLVAILELDTYLSPRNMAHPPKATHLACLLRNCFSIFSRLASSVSFLISAILSPNARGARNFSKILDARRALEERGNTLLWLLSSPLSLFI